jgi:hypothetical protein
MRETRKDDEKNQNAANAKIRANLASNYINARKMRQAFSYV